MNYEQLFYSFLSKVDALDFEADMMRYFVDRFNPISGVAGNDEYWGYVWHYYNEKVIPHKVEVYKAGMRLADIVKATNADWKRQLLIHDLSKFSLEEHIYAHYFSDRKEYMKDIEEKWGLAWHHH